MTFMRSVIATLALALGLNSLAAKAMEGLAPGSKVKAKGGEKGGKDSSNRSGDPSCVGGF